MIFEDDFDFTVPKSEVVSHALNHNGVLRTICDCAHGLLEGAILGILGDPRGWCQTLSWWLPFSCLCL